VEEDALFPGGRIVHVAGLGGDVHVSAHRDEVALLEAPIQEGPQPPQPLQLVGPLVRADLAAVRDVDAHYVHPAHPGRHEPSLEVVASVTEAALDLLGLGAGEDGDAVVSPLRVDGRVVAEGPELVEGEGLVRDLELLEAKDVGTGRREPPQQAALARPDRVDVPRRELHGTKGGREDTTSQPGSSRLPG
jgi:hypothetical protein